METFRITTLVDITRTQVSRSEIDLKKIGQQANFNSLIQAIGLRSNVEWGRDPERKTGRLLGLGGKANHWLWTFHVERDFVFFKDNDHAGLLLDDLNNVPVIAGLEESVDLIPSVFSTRGNSINTWCERII
jgi:hypothetical protein